MTLALLIIRVVAWVAIDAELTWLIARPISRLEIPASQKLILIRGITVVFLLQTAYLAANGWRV